MLRVPSLASTEKVISLDYLVKAWILGVETGIRRSRLGTPPLIKQVASFLLSVTSKTWITVVILELTHANQLRCIYNLWCPLGRGVRSCP